MDLPKNNLKAALAEKRCQLGLWMSSSDPLQVELMAGTGFDWVLIDMEHSPNDTAKVAQLLQAASSYDVSTCVRVPWNDVVAIKRVLDVGAQTIVVPYVQSVAEAEAAVAAVRYPPRGVRGVGGSTRATRFGAVADYATRADEEICLILQVETEAALPLTEDIAAVDGVDGIFIGPADLAASMGHPGDTAHPEVRAAVVDVTRRIRDAGKAPGFLSASPDYCREVQDAGALFLGIDIDTIALKRSLVERVTSFR